MKTISFFLSISMICLFTNCTPFGGEASPDCKPPITTLPPETMLGGQTIGFTINDTLNWVAQVPFGSGISGLEKMDVNWTHEPRFISITASRVHETSCEKIYDWLSIHFSDLNEGENSLTNPDAVRYRDRENGLLYKPDTTYQNIVNITHFDEENTSVSGTFEFRLINEDDSTDVLHLTDGRFDGNYAF